MKPSLRVKITIIFSSTQHLPFNFTFRIVPMKLHACGKRRLNGGVRGSLVATPTAARCQGPRFYSGQGRNLDRVFCSMRTAVPPLGPQHRVPEPVTSLETRIKSELALSEGSTEWVAISRP